jgi:hypothetical protein
MYVVGFFREATHISTFIYWFIGIGTHNREVDRSEICRAGWQARYWSES